MKATIPPTIASTSTPSRIGTHETETRRTSFSRCALARAAALGSNRVVVGPTAAATPGPGTVNVFPHPGHFARLPAQSSFTFRALPQLSQVTEIGITFTLGLKNLLYHSRNPS